VENIAEFNSKLSKLINVVEDDPEFQKLDSNNKTKFIS
jgi:hypothetical protein